MGFDPGTIALIAAIAGGVGSAARAAGAGGADVTGFPEGQVRGAVTDTQRLITEQINAGRDIARLPISSPGVDISGALGSANIPGAPSGLVGLFPEFQTAVAEGFSVPGIDLPEFKPGNVNFGQPRDPGRGPGDRGGDRRPPGDDPEVDTKGEVEPGGLGDVVRPVGGRGAASLTADVTPDEKSQTLDQIAQVIQSLIDSPVGARRARA